MGSWFDDKLTEMGRLDLRPAAQASVIEEIPDAELVAGCDLNPEVLEAFGNRWGVTSLYTDVKQMLAHEELDIVSIVTAWGSTHGELAALVAESGRVRGIYCEKPIGASMRQADRIVAAVERDNLVFTCAYLRRWNQRYRAVRSVIESGAIGEVRSIHASSISTLMHAGTHYLDIMAYLAGEPQPSWLVGGIEGSGQDPTAGGYLVMENGVRFLFEGSPGPIAFLVTGTEGRIFLLNDANEAYMWRRTDSPRRQEPVPIDLGEQGKSTTLRAMEELVACVRKRDPHTSCDATTAARAMEMALGIHSSEANGNARVTFPLADRELSVDTK